MLGRPDSALFAWRWDPNDKTPIADTNNATDGDMLIAWALALAGRRWHAPDYEAAARRIIVDIRKKLITRVAGRLVLLPGSDGFEQKDGSVIVNPSYYIYPALEAFSHLDRSVEWGRLRLDGLGLLARARWGEWGLPVDWVSVEKDGKVYPAAQQQPRFGFDAIRIPLYLIWGRAATVQLLAPMMKFWDGFGTTEAGAVEAWIDVTSGARWRRFRRRAGFAPSSNSCAPGCTPRPQTCRRSPTPTTTIRRASSCSPSWRSAPSATEWARQAEAYVTAARRGPRPVGRAV